MTNQIVPLLSPSEASAALGEFGVPRTVATLAKLRVKGGGPRFHRFGRAIRYSRVDLESWVQENLSQPLRSTSDISPERD